MDPGNHKLSPKATRLLSAMLASSSISEAAGAARIPYTTAKRIAADPAFRAALDDARTEAFETTAATLASRSVQAVEVLVSIMSNQKVKPSVRVSAAGRLIELANGLRQTITLERRVDAIEALLRETES